MLCAAGGSELATVPPSLMATDVRNEADALLRLAEDLSREAPPRSPVRASPARGCLLDLAALFLSSCSPGISPCALHVETVTGHFRGRPVTGPSFYRAFLYAHTC
jgi:hypothetical protein